MNKHETMMEKIFLFDDPELSEAERRDIADHVKDCSACDQALQRFRSVSLYLKKMEEPEPRPFLTTTIMASIREKEFRKSLSLFQRMKRLQRFAYGSALTLFLISLAALMSQQDNPISTDNLLVAQSQTSPDDTDDIVLDDELAFPWEEL